MEIEYEATFENIDKNEIRNKLKKIGANLVKPECLHKRITFHLPSHVDVPHSFIRVRDEGDKITVTLKVSNGDGIERTKEINLDVGSMKKAEELLTFLGCKKKAYQENKRELWKFKNVEITIDEWPFLEPIVEIEGRSEGEVKEVSEKLSFDYKNAIFGPITVIYVKKYGIAKDIINNKTPKIVFDMDNPFLNE